MPGGETRQNWRKEIDSQKILARIFHNWIFTFQKPWISGKINKTKPTPRNMLEKLLNTLTKETW